MNREKRLIGRRDSISKSMNHKGHEGPRRLQSEAFLREPSCPLWLMLCARVRNHRVQMVKFTVMRLSVSTA